MFGFAWTGRVGNDAAIGNGRVTLIHDEADAEDGLGGWLVKGRKSASRIGGLELRNGITAAGGLAEVEAAKLVVQDAFVTDMDIGRTRGKIFGYGECGGLILFVGGNGGGLA